MNRSGFSLIEALIVMGLMTAAALGYMKFMRDQAVGHKTNIVRAEIEDMTREIKTHLHTSKSCMATFKEGKIQSGKMKINTIIDRFERERYKVGETYNEGIKINEMYTDGLLKDDENIAVSTFYIKFGKPKGTLGGKEYTKKFELGFHLDNNEILDCGRLDKVTNLKDEKVNIEEESQKNSDIAETDVNLDKKDIDKVIKDNPEVKKMFESLKSIEKNRIEMEKMINEMD